MYKIHAKNIKYFENFRAKDVEITSKLHLKEL